MPSLRTIVDFSFLVLSIVLVATLLSNSYDREILQTQSYEIQVARKEFLDVMSKNIEYTESRVNRLATSQDSYQTGMSSRVNVLEQRMQSLEFRKRENTRIVNNNSAVANGQPQ